MTTRDIGAIVHGLCIVAAVMACSSWTVPLSEAGIVAMPGSPAGQPSATRPAVQRNYVLA
ncbi:hypothetical protein [Allosphingosinicella sp.]|uniref:hypothetical protein n=1 Tax=Allosphingosinicella sp. TaxID=2823234 RepID=UPI002FC1FD25